MPRTTFFLAALIASIPALMGACGGGGGKTVETGGATTPDPPAKYVEPDLSRWKIDAPSVSADQARQRIDGLIKILPPAVADLLMGAEQNIAYINAFVVPIGPAHEPSVANYILDIARAYLDLERSLTNRKERYGAALAARVVFKKYRTAINPEWATHPPPRLSEFGFFATELGLRLGDLDFADLCGIGINKPGEFRQLGSIVQGDLACERGKSQEANYHYLYAATNLYSAGDNGTSDARVAEIARDRPMCGEPSKVVAEYVREVHGGVVRPVAAAATSRESASRPTASWPDLSTPASGGKPHPDDAAVVVAIERYMAVPEVSGARRNANDWFRHFSSRLGIPATRIELLRDNEATVEKMRAASAKAAASAGPKGTLWFVFIGHGAPAKDGKDGILVGADAQQDADGLYARSLPQKELLATLAKGKQRQTVVVLDACFSGRTGQGAAIAKGLQPLIPVAAEVAKQSSATVLTAGAGSEFAGPLSGVDRPAFSYLLLGAMRGWADDNKDGIVTASEAIAYTRQTLSATVKGRTQTPELVSPDANVPLSEGARDTAPNLSEIVVGGK